MKNVNECHPLNHGSLKTPSFLLLACLTIITLTSFHTKPVTFDNPPAMSLYDSIVAVDALWEDAYDNCKLDVMSEIISEDLEFYHDQGGFMTSQPQLIEAVKKNICGKVTRELKAGSIEVYRIPGYGAVEMGQHGFHNNQEPSAKTHFAKFVFIWKKENGKFRMTRVISLH
jgi:hypothetical protein